ncbi:hypothetical protein DPMN_119593 [Dreissena polymorpha]|uniref:Uncharacterized protein n=1 Tax=Dreissena polymorpha TaxID=45954 RepID=A0A9D4GM11_DREPO|nr:hypothetical protein DPMN_119593 [Dreissena polymorpha]
MVDRWDKRENWPSELCVFGDHGNGMRGNHDNIEGWIPARGDWNKLIDGGSDVIGSCL